MFCDMAHGWQVAGCKLGSKVKRGVVDDPGRIECLCTAQ